MKVALVHELLTMRGGAEQVLRIMADMYPDAPIYTLLHNKQKLEEWFPSERIVTSPLQKYAGISTNHHLYLSRFPKAVESWDFFGYDLVISTSSAFAHGIITNGKPKHLAYIHSPARYLFDRTHDVLNRVNPLERWYLNRVFHKLRMWTTEAAQRPDAMIAASKEVRRRIELYWRRESDVLYPPIADSWLDVTPSESHDGYYFLASTLVPYKRIDLAIKACNKGQRRLKIAGEGPDMTRLKRLAGPTVEFLGYVPHDELVTLYRNAHATLFPGEEDFGLVPLESMACGTPVIAYAQGGALETIVDGETGLFFDKPTPDSLLEAIRRREEHIFDHERCARHIMSFSRAHFEKGIRDAVTTLMS